MNLVSIEALKAAKGRWVALPHDSEPGSPHLRIWQAPKKHHPNQVRRPSIPGPVGGYAAVNGGAFGTTSREATRCRLRYAPSGQHVVVPLQQRASAANSDDGRRVVDVGSIRRYHPSLPRMKTQVLSKKRKTRSRDVNAAANMERAMLA